jgi:carotenoid cleavage dioxygenase
MAENPYLQGNFAPVEAELTAGPLEVSGSVPDHLDGRYLRIGPNPLGATAPDYHWFLGDGMVHGVRLQDGAAQWYRNRYVRSDAVADALGEPRHPGPRHAGFDLSPNTNVISHAGRTLALVEAGPLPYELTEDLDTVGSCDFDGTLTGGYTAHPHLDPATGELHSISYSWAWGNRVRYDVVGADGKVRRSVDIRTHGRPMIHDFALTENYVVLFDLPVSFSNSRAARSTPAPMRPFARATLAATGRARIPDKVAAAMSGSSSVGRSSSAAVGFPYLWDPSYPARVGLLPRSGTGRDVRWFEVDPCYVFHAMNAYEDGDTVVCDVVRHPKTFATELRGPNEGPPTLDRWRIDTSAGKVLEERIDDSGQEFPRIDERLTGQRHRFGYSVAVGPEGEDCLFKHDLVSGRRTVRRLDGGQLSEFVFVPSSADAGEDDGVLMGFAYNRDRDRSDLKLLDAETLETVGSVHLPTRVPQGFHGNWAPTVDRM